MDRKRIQLEDIERKHLFSAPDGYFDELPSIIQSKIPTKEVEVSWFSARKVATWSAAASVLVGLFWVTLPLRQGPMEPDSLVAVSDDAIVEYLHTQDMDYYDLAQQSVIQEAFADESTLMNYLDLVDDASIQEQLLDSEELEVLI